MTFDTASPRTLGSLPSVGPLAFGHWRFVGHEVSKATELVESALDLGMNLIDTADVYGLDWGGTEFGQAEGLLGQVLAGSPGLRDRMVLATKGGIVPPLPYDSSHDHLTSALEASLRRLGVDHIDLYQVHRPDMFTHPDDLAATLQGKRFDASAALVVEGRNAKMPATRGRRWSGRRDSNPRHPAWKVSGS